MNSKIKNRKKYINEAYENLEKNQYLLEKVCLDILKDEKMKDEEIDEVLTLLDETESCMKQTIGLSGKYIEFYSIHDEIMKLLDDRENQFTEEPIII